MMAKISCIRRIEIASLEEASANGGRAIEGENRGKIEEMTYGEMVKPWPERRAGVIGSRL